MTAILAGAVGGAVLFTLYGLIMRRRAAQGCACGSIFGGCGSCPAQSERVESDHVER